jgi:hypothetical protein
MFHPHREPLDATAEQPLAHLLVHVEDSAGLGNLELPEPRLTCRDVQA